MKTTIELPNALFAAAKAVAAKRRTTLKAMMEHALRREIAFESSDPSTAPVEVNAHGFPVLRRKSKTKVTSEHVYQMLEEESA
ncbi:MAG: hypothetical protein JNM99_24725 [Verrucomicrobiaceae bacterium]|nr:hypothetical protein [Verrucomicrobiaceae bacterium]